MSNFTSYAKMLLRKCNKEQKSIAREMGVSESHVSDMLKCRREPEQVVKYMVNNLDISSEERWRLQELAGEQSGEHKDLYDYINNSSTWREILREARDQ